MSIRARHWTGSLWCVTGLPAAGAVDAAVRAVGIGQTDLAKLLDIPERTLARRKKEGTLNRDESGKLVRLARVVERAAEVFGGWASRTGLAQVAECGTRERQSDFIARHRFGC